VLALKASVRNGRLVLDEPTELPEGSTVELIMITDDNDFDGLDNAEREALHAALVEGIAQDDAGETLAASDVLARFRARVA